MRIISSVEGGVLRGLGAGGTNGAGFLSIASRSEPPCFLAYVVRTNRASMWRRRFRPEPFWAAPSEVENPLFAFRWRHRRGVAAKAPAKLGKMFVNAYI